MANPAARGFISGSNTHASTGAPLGNSTDTALGADAVFTGAIEDCSAFLGISIYVATDQAGTLVVSFSTDGENFDTSHSYTVNAGAAGVLAQRRVEARYFRVTLTNGSTPQTYLRLQTILNVHRNVLTNDIISIAWPDRAATVDAFGRQRVSQVTSLVDVKHPNDKNTPIVDEELIGTGASVYSATDASVTLSTSADADAAIRQTYQRAPYFAGKSQQYFFTFTNMATETNATKRVGCFHTSSVSPFTASLDGIYLESSDDYYFVVTKSGTETARIARADWNDPLDGTGESGINLDFTKAQILQVDYEYLGVGFVRFSFVVSGTIILAHYYAHSNAGESTYMTHSNQPIRYEIRQSGAGSADLEMICATAGTEGGVNTLGLDGTVSTGNSVVACAATTSTYAICGIRLGTKLNLHVHISDISLIATTNDNLQWELRRNPTVTGTFTYAATNGIEAATGVAGSPTVSGGDILASGYVASSGTVELQKDTALHLGVGIDGTVDEFVLCVSSFSNNANVAASIVWLEEL